MDDLLNQISLYLFYGIVALIGISSIMVIATRNPVKSAIFLVLDLFLFSCLYAYLGAHFVAAIQILIYAGAIVVLFLFVIMLLNLKKDTSYWSKFSPIDIGVLGLSVMGFLVLGFYLLRSSVSGFDATVVTDQKVLSEVGGHTKALSLRLFSRYVWPFELASILILLAIVVCVFIAKKEKEST